MEHSSAGGSWRGTSRSDRDGRTLHVPGACFAECVLIADAVEEVCGGGGGGDEAGQAHGSL